MHHLFAKGKAVLQKTSTNQRVNKNCKKVRWKWIVTFWTHHAIISLLYWWHTPSRKGLQTNETSIWIVTKVFSMVMPFQLPPCTICVNTQVSKAVMATAFESVQSIATTILPAARIKNHAFLYFIETLGMHCKLAIMYSPIQAPYAVINYFFHSPPFHLWNIWGKQNWDLNLKWYWKEG